MQKSKQRDKANRKNTRQSKRESPEQFFDPMLSHLTPTQRKRPRKPLAAKNEAQGQLIASVLSRDITFATGPAGTGKSYVVASLASEALESGTIDTLVITRPMKSCDEDMGFLPGEIEDKYAPWLAPVLDVLEERLGASCVEYLIKRIQTIPLQFMRGKSFRDTWVILDEAQNTTPEQMKMFLTRIGSNSKLIINGDINQSDLKDGRGVMQTSGLSDALSKLRGIPEIGRVEFSRDDIVRHGIVRTILERYEG
jgi:phosphate starvation-inducible protein PhoH and related proteins